MKKVNLKLIEKYFVKNLGFQSVIKNEYLENDQIEECLFLLKSNYGHIDIIKFKDDDEYDITIQGDIHSDFWDCEKFLMYFQDRQDLIDCGHISFVVKMDEEIKQLEKEF